jgi:hypothetical protein
MSLRAETIKVLSFVYKDFAPNGAKKSCKLGGAFA